MNKLLEKLRSGKRAPVIIGVTIGALLLLIGTLTENSDQKSNADSDQYNTLDVSLYTNMLEKRIENLCRSVGGINDATVLLTLDCGSELIYAQNGSEDIKESSYSAATDYLVIDRGDGSAPLQLCEIYPKIRGVAVVCTGGDKASVAKTVTDLLSAALGIPTNKIMVAGM